MRQLVNMLRMVKLERLKYILVTKSLYQIAAIDFQTFVRRDNQLNFFIMFS